MGASGTPNDGTPAASRLVLGRTGLPTRQHRRVLAFRATVERLVAEAHEGRVDALAGKRIATACLALAESLRAQRRLVRAEAGEITLTEAELQGWSDRVGRNHDRCDRILASLGLDKRTDDPWGQLYAGLRQQQAEQAHRTALERPADRPGAEEA